MKLPSIEEILRSAGRTFSRFPFVILNAALGTATALILIDHEGPSVPTVLFRILFATLLGVSFFTTAALTAEKRGWGKPAGYAAGLVAAVLLFAYALTVPLEVDRAPNHHFIRFVMLGAALHFLVAFAPYAGKGSVNGFWQYNRTMAIRFLMTAVFAGVLYAGLAVALAALDNLFEINVPFKRYAGLWALIAGMFTPWFFLAGLPERLDELDATSEYPKVVKVFAQYILLPLVIVYVVILYAYAVKIVAGWSWPRGWVSGLILGYGAAGVLSTLLLHPVRDSEGHGWIRKASAWFFASLLPLVPMLVLAVWRRVSEYGVTEGRYVALVLGLWLGVIAVYFLVSRARDIRVVPASLFVVSLVAAFGPLSAFSISESSQVARLRGLLERHSMLADGSARTAPAPVPLDDRREISSILHYLREVHGYESIQPWFAESLREDSAAEGVRYRAPADVARMLGVEYVAEWMSEEQSIVSFDARRDAVLDVAGYDGLLRGVTVHQGMEPPKEIAEGVRYRANPALDSLAVVAWRGGAAVDSVTIGLRPLLDSLLVEYSKMSAHAVDPGKLSLAAESPGMVVRVYFSRITLEKHAGGPKVLSYDASILFRLRPE